MSSIKLLDQNTINQIAAGEVIDRPSSVVKELLENAIDAKATSITIEIKEGGLSFIRITDNGTGIEKSDIPVAFLRHSTSKIRNAMDLLTISSLGFRGEALSSIAAIAQVELISKVASQITGTRYLIEGGKEKSIEEIGAPNGTTFIVRNLFFNTPARRKFLKSATTEATYINNIVERIAMSHPNISIRLINNGANKLFTPGSDEVKNIIYHIYGKDISKNLIEVNKSAQDISLCGYIGMPYVARGNRNGENYFINGRYIKSSLITKAIEDAYKPYLMQNKYPFTVMHIEISPELIDVNVHPSKMEIRFTNADELYTFLFREISNALEEKEYIPEIKLEQNAPKIEESKRTIPERIMVAEPFETKRLEIIKEEKNYSIEEPRPVEVEQQVSLFKDKFISQEAIINHKLIGQVFDTYWLIEYEDKLFIIDQHAAHEKVYYERYLKALENRENTSQIISPPLIISLTNQEVDLLKGYAMIFQEMGFEIEHFGGNEYAIRAVPANIYSVNAKELFLNIIDDLMDDVQQLNHVLIKEKIALLACKAAVKGNNRLSYSEMNELIRELLTLENPYNCPHGRPTIISMSRYELEKKFKRII